MRRKLFVYIWIAAALCLLLAGCTAAIGAESDERTAPASTEQTEPAPTEPAPPAPDVGLAGTVMKLPEELPVVNAENPELWLNVAFPEVDLTGAEGGRRCNLRVLQGEQELTCLKGFLLLPKAEHTFVLKIPFTRYMEEESGLTVRLEYGQEVLEQSLPLTLENYPDEVYAAMSGDKRPYYIEVVKNQNVVIVYGKDQEGAYSVPVKVFVCSTGRTTPIGTYSLGWKNPWRSLFGGVYGQYAMHITGNYLFHSVPYYRPQKNMLETQEYNKLGTTCSMGCVRLAVEDVKWIYDFCPSGTKVRICNADTLAVEKPVPMYIDPESPNAGWDPTDPDEANPWKDN